MQHKKLFNSTSQPIIICNATDLRRKITEALALSKKMICRKLGLDKASQQDGICEKARNGATRYSLFKYLDHFEDDFVLDEAWLMEVYRLAHVDPKDSKKEFHTILPENSKHIKITQNDARGLRTDLRLFLHCCWATRFLLLPVKYAGLPVFKKDLHSSPLEFAFDAYPEILKVLRKPFNETLDFDINIKDFIPEKALPNLNWYAPRYARACAAWDIEDITDELLDEVSSIPGVPRTTDWYYALHACVPDRVKFSTNNLYSNRIALSGQRKKLSQANFSSLQIEKHPAINSWIKDTNEYIDTLKENGLKTYYKHQTVIRKAMEILMSSNETLPEPSQITREQAKLIKIKLGEGIQPQTLKGLLYKLENFYDYLEVVHKSFKKPISRNLDFPKSSRPKGTNKKLMPEDSFPVYLSYLYGVAEWVWYINHHHPKRDEFIQNRDTQDKTINTSDSGFIPIFRFNDNYYPIEEIPTRIAPVHYPKIAKDSQLKSHTFIPHYIHLNIVIAETGIRLIAARWLNEETYDKAVNRSLFSEHSYMITKLWVNSDKSHDAWEADVVESVIGILDRQSKWKQQFLNGKDIPIFYDGHEHSKFEMIRPLFAQVNNNYRVTDSFTTVSDGTFRTVFRYILLHFSYIYSQLDVMDMTPIEIDDDLDLAGNLARVKEMKGDKRIKITPHSMRSQVVSNKITILPPHILKRSTGHINDACVIYYAQISPRFLDTQRAAQEEEFRNFITPMAINTRSEHSALRQAFGKNADAAMSDFGAITFSDHTSQKNRNGIKVVKDMLEELENKPEDTLSIIDMLAFNSTHICPFNNKCPTDIKADSMLGLTPCGGCPYAIKTVDNLPAISAHIRSLTDKAAVHETTINEAKDNGEDMGAYMNDVALRKFYTQELSAWAITTICLDSMARDLSQKDKWLVNKPEFIEKKFQKLTASNELTYTLVQIEEAINDQEFMTPQLKAKVSLFRNKVLAATGQFNTLLQSVPTGRTLLSDFKGMIKNVCNLSGITVDELPNKLESIQMDAQKALGNALNFPLPNSGDNSDA
ncbi:hypothetical protein [Vibrio alginolyticus]|uniref:hypothetical protein n=1 Tax=Vibrio alginolyticus TaxID=663 RepID=UPI003D134F89